MKHTITLTVPISDQFLADVLCTALEGGIGYWAQAHDIERSEHDADGNWRYVSAVLSDAEGEPGDFVPIKVDYAAVAAGIRMLLAPDFPLDSAIKADIFEAVSQHNAGFIDANAADAIVQAACFGDIIYG